MPRKRTTWNTPEQGKTASPPPQIPAVDRTEGPSSPAYYPDPDADKYKDGDTSSWAEDPHKPMSPESPPPAMPGNLTTDKLTHPGTSEFSKTPESPAEALAAGGGGGTKQASLKEMAEARATLCVRIASALLKDADAAAVENKALELMDLDDAQLQATASTLKLVAGEEEEEEEEEIEVEGGKKAAVEVTARLDRIEASMGKLVKAMGHFFGMNGDDDMSDKELMAYLTAEDMDGDGIDQSKNDYPQGYDVDKLSGEDEFERGEESEGTKEFDEAEGDKMAMDDEESMLRAMLEEMDEEMSMTASQKKALESEDNQDPLAKGQSIQSGEGGNVNPDEYAPTPVVAQSDGSEKVGDPTPHGKAAGEGNPADNDIDITAGADPMGLMSDDNTREASADDELMQLYSDLDLPKTAKKAESEEEEVEEEAKEEPADAGAGTDEKAEKDDEEFGADDEGKKGGKKAGEEPALKPQPKAASQGAQVLGNVSGMPKAAADEMAQLSKLWDSAPDVSSVFGVPSSS